MLILTRKVGETLVIGEDVAVTVLGIKGGQVRIGIAAPADVRVVREELLGTPVPAPHAGNRPPHPI